MDNKNNSLLFDKHNLVVGRLTVDHEPKREDANEDGYVLAWDMTANKWVERFWFDFMSHPEWSEKERNEILFRYPVWKPIADKKVEKNISIYTLIAIPGCIHSSASSSSRCFGWYPFFEEAELAVLQNQASLNENGYYKWIVIEETSCGVFPIVSRQWWYMWDGENYIPTDKPSVFNNLINWGIG